MNGIISLETKKYLQDKGLLFWMIILPIAFTVIFISVFTSGVDSDTREQVITSIIPGYTVMCVFFIMINMVDTILKDKNYGMTARIASTPLSPYKYLVGKWVPNLLVVMIQIGILFSFGKIVYGVSWKQPLILFMLTILIAFTVTGIGLALAFLVNTINMGIAITQVIAMGGAVLSGLWVPISMMPDFIQNIAKFLPQYWAHQGYQNAMAGVLESTLLLHVSLVLLGYGFIGFLIAIFRYPRFLKRARG
ncbi:ABC transporter permease [Ornithinibacillus californiensis]|uniref:ABC transporter permease n=1 Tax=Ornithinibacillus californiensis TaxID=161536 RepID=UPI00064D9BA3|nr:ABC transporter permease [Ornithinibacillus californiensis]